MRILLMGNPNVGKSVVFSRLTGVRVIASNYPGTTVSYTRGYMKLGEDRAEVIDVPGTYTLEPTCEAEEVALRMLDSGDVVVNVVNATNLERNLYLTLQLLERRVPVIVALNMWDDTKHRGIYIDVDKLRELLGVPVIPTIATTGEASRKIGITEQTYYRWRKEYGGMRVEQAKRLKELEKENSRLKKLVADLSLDNSILKEAARGNF